MRRKTLAKNGIRSASSRPDPSPPGAVLIRIDKVTAKTGMGSSVLYDKIAKKEFPAPVKIGKRAVAWELSAVERWIQERISASKENAA
jgi:prophage regulatory protein